MNPELKVYLDQHYTELRAEWEKDYKAESSVRHHANIGNVNEVMTNMAVQALDIREEQNHSLDFKKEAIAVTGNAVYTTMVFDSVKDQISHKQELHRAAGKRRELTEFLSACEATIFDSIAQQDELVRVLTHQKNNPRLAADIRTKMSVYASAEGMQEISDRVMDLNALQNFDLSIINGTDIKVMVVHEPRKEGQNEEKYKAALNAERGRLIGSAPNGEVIVFLADLLDYDKIFAEVSEKPEFKQFQGMQLEDFTDPDYRKTIIDGGSFEWPETIPFDITRSAFIDQETLIADMVDQEAPAVARMQDYYSMVMNTVFDHQHEISPSRRSIGEAFFTQSEGNELLSEADKGMLVKQIEQLSFGTEWFDTNIGAVLNKDEKKLMEEAGKSFEDIVFIGGKSVRELYGQRYGELPANLREREIKTQVTAAVLEAEQPISMVSFVKNAKGEIVATPHAYITRNVEPFQKTKQEQDAYLDKQTMINDRSTFISGYDKNVIVFPADGPQKQMTGGMTTDDIMLIFGPESSHPTVPWDEMEAGDPWRVRYEAEEMPLRKQAVKTFYEMKRSGVSRREISRSDGGELAHILSIEIAENHPEYHLADILDPSRSKDKEAIDSLKEAMGPRLMERMGSREGLAEVLTECNRFYAHVDLGREAEYAAGISSDLPEQERRTLYQEKQNDGAMSAFYKSFASSTQGYKQLINGLGSGFGVRGFALGKMGEAEKDILRANLPGALDLRNRLEAGLGEKQLLQYSNGLELLAIIGNSSDQRAKAIKSGENVGEEVMLRLCQGEILRERMSVRQPTSRIIAPFTFAQSNEGIEALLEKTSSDERQQTVLYKAPDRIRNKLLYNQEPIPDTPLYDASQFSSDVELSDSLITKIRELDERRSTVITTCLEFKAANPSLSGDVRDFYVMLDTNGLSRPDMIPGREQTQIMLEDYYDTEHPERRERVLDNLFDRAACFDIRALDLSILTKNPPTDERKREKSEADFMKLLQIVDLDQSLKTKLAENPEYEKKRFSDPIKRAHYENQTTLMLTVDSFIMNTVFPNSGYGRDMKEYTESRKAQSFKHFSGTITTAIKLYSDRERALSGEKSDGILPFVATATMEKLIGMDKSQRPLDVKVKNLAHNCLNDLFESTFAEGKKDWESAGIDRLTQIFYIDGKSAEELYGSQYDALSPKDKEWAMQAEIMSAILSGEHHVDVATLVQTPFGHVNIQMYALKEDLSALDAKQKEVGHWYETLSSKKAEKTWNNDKKRESRLHAETVAISEKMISSMESSMRDKDEVRWAAEAAEAAESARATTAAEVKSQPQIKEKVEIQFSDFAAAARTPIVEAPVASAEILSVEAKKPEVKTAVKQEVEFSAFCSEKEVVTTAVPSAKKTVPEKNNEK